MRQAIVALLFFVSPVFAEAAPPQGGAITCAAPVAPNDSAKSLKERYGTEAAVEELPFGEGETQKGIALFPRAIDRRIEVFFADDKMTRVSQVTIRNDARTSRWAVAGLTIGSSLADVQQVNGKRFLVVGFEWDYPGYVADWLNGALSRPLSGGCKVAVQFGGSHESPPDSLLGEVKLSSEDAELIKYAPIVTGLSVNFPNADPSRNQSASQKKGGLWPAFR